MSDTTTTTTPAALVAMRRRAKLIPGRYRYADAHDMYQLLGVTSLPAAGMPERTIEGVRVYVKPLEPKTGQRRNFQGLRVMAICECGQHLAVGRLHQHQCAAAAACTDSPACAAAGCDDCQRSYGPRR